MAVFFADPTRVFLTLVLIFFVVFLLFIVSYRIISFVPYHLSFTVIVLIIPFLFSSYSFFIGRKVVYQVKYVHPQAYKKVNDDYIFTLKDGTKVILNKNDVHYEEKPSEKKNDLEVTLEVYLPRKTYRDEVKPIGSNAVFTKYHAMLD